VKTDRWICKARGT